MLMILAAALVSTSVLAPTASASVYTRSRHVHKPSENQLVRLDQYADYIDYFTSLGYGPNDSNVSAEYIRALILTESSGDKFALSHKGARGLTQIMPETGRMAAREIVMDGVDYRYVSEQSLIYYDPDVLYDPATNILIACYLSALYHTDYRGQHELVAAAWNAGPEAVARFGYALPPYRETHGMVQRLVGFLNYFSLAGAAPRDDRAPAWVDYTSPRWDTRGWDAPGWETPENLSEEFATNP